MRWQHLIIMVLITLFIGLIWPIASESSVKMRKDLKNGEGSGEIEVKPIVDDGSAMLDRQIFNEQYTDDLDDLIRRGAIRVLVEMSKTRFFTVRGRPRGFEYDMIQKYKKYLKTRVRASSWPVIFVFIPMPFDDLLPALVEGRGDIVAAGLTVTTERQKLVSFTKPYLSNVKEVVVTNAGVGPIKNIEGLSGRNVVVRKGTSFVEHLLELNERLAAGKKKPVNIIEIDSILSNEDILELVNAGVIEFTIVDDHIAEIWSRILPNIVVYNDLTLNSGGKIAWAVRKNNPELNRSLSIITRKNRRGSLIGNIFFKRYYQNTKWVTNPLGSEEMKRLVELRSLFEHYASLYGFDWLVLAALAYQESRLDHAVQSKAGAVGIMQVMPETAKAPPIGISNVREIEGNIHAGVKYLAYLHDNYFNDPGISPAAKVDFSLAAYNAGPTRINRLRRAAKRAGLNPNIWFNHVEQIARRTIGRETVTYVANVNKYYIAYRLGLGLMENRERAIKAIQSRCPNAAK